MDFTPITLDLCTLVAFDEGHLNARYVGWLNDPDVIRYSEQRHRKHDLISCRSYYESFANSDDLFLAIEAADPRLGHVGNVTVAHDRPNGSADVSIMIGEAAARGSGIGTAAWCGIIEWLIGPGKVRRVTAGTMANNAPMLALMRKSNMTIDAVRPRAFLFNDEEVDLVMAVRFAQSR